MKTSHILVLSVLSAMGIFFLSDKEGTYLIGSEAQIYTLFSAVLISVSINTKLKNEFLELLNVVFVIFYVLRVPFIVLDTVYSDVISRGIPSDAVQSSLWVLIYQYCSLLAAIIMINPKIRRERTQMISQRLFKRVLLYAYTIVLVNSLYISTSWQYGASTLPFELAILTAIFTLQNATSIVCLAVLLIQKEVLEKYKYALIGFFALTILTLIYIGNKSALLSIMLACILALIVVRGTSARVSMRSVVFCIVCLCLSLIIFVVGQGFRNFQRQQFALDDISGYLLSGLDKFDQLLSGFSYRIGYIDFFVEKLSNPAYIPVVQFQHYFEAIIDKVTPGFDIFQTSFLSRDLYTVYFGPDAAGANSEIITLFAESHMLMGYYSFVLYLFACVLVKASLNAASKFHGFSFSLLCLYVFGGFYAFLNSAGLDMVICLDLLYSGIFIAVSIVILAPKGSTALRIWEFPLDFGVRGRR